MISFAGGVTTISAVVILLLVFIVRGVDFGGYQDHKVNGGEDVLTIAYSELIGPLIKALQEVNQKFDALKQEFDDYVEQY